MKYTSRIYFVFFIIFSSHVSYSQSLSFKDLLETGKAEIKKEYDSIDYVNVVEILEKAALLRPTDQEAHYFLGYAYSRLNSKDGRTIPKVKLELTIKSSNEFEKVIKLNPKYKGEVMVLDPYSKITSEWGTLALSYLSKNKNDSAIFAFTEGKKRGGFSDFMLSFTNNMLQTCDSNSVIFLTGDITTYALLYNQNINQIRKDISIVNLDLLNTIWYPAYLNHKNQLLLNMTDSMRDTLEYCNWKDTVMSVGDFSWEVKPSYLGEYILRGDRILLSFLFQNNFKKTLYFANGTDPNCTLGLEKNFQNLIYLDRLNFDNKPEMDYDEYKSRIKEAVNLVKKSDLNRFTEDIFLDYIGYSILYKAYMLIGNNKIKETKEMLRLMEKFIDESNYPISESWKQSLDYIKDSIKNNK